MGHLVRLKSLMPTTSVETTALFIRDHRRRNLSQKTIANRSNVLNLFDTWLGRDILTATTEEIELWLDRISNPRTRISYLDAFRSFYSFAIRTGLAAEDPVCDIIRPRTGRLLPRPISTEDLDHALRLAPPKMRAWLALAAFEGFRCNEIAHLCREDIHDSGSMPMIVVRQGKGDKDRMLPLNAIAEAALRSYGLPRTGFVFMTNRDGPFKPASVSGMISAYLTSVGVIATAHQLRHYFGSTLYALTKDIRVTQEMLGHSSPKTTAIYVSYDASLAFDAVRSMDLRVRRLAS